MPKIYVLSKNKKTVKKNHLKIIIFEAVKNCNKLYRRVFVMGVLFISMSGSSN